MLNYKKLFISIALVPAISASVNTYAGSYEFENFNLEWDTVFTAGLQYRTQARKSSLSDGSNGSAGDLENLATIIDNAFLLNSNDGNNNFDQGFTSQRLSILSEADFNFGDWGIFLRGKMWHNFIYSQENDMDEQGWAENNANPIFGDNGGHNTTFGNFNPAAKDYSEAGSRLLDVFLYSTIALPNDREISLRIGRQVISWGEALLSGGGIAMGINHVDAHIRNQPGLEIKELFLPNGAIFLQTAINDMIGLEAYYQYEWQPAFLDPSSSYFSEFDSIGTGGNTFMFVSGTEDSILGVELNDNIGKIKPPIVDGQYAYVPDDPNDPNDDPWDEQNTQLDRLLQYLPTNCPVNSDKDHKCRSLVPYKLKEDKPGDEGQFGIALNFFLESGDEFGLYFVNYHEKIPNWVLPLDVLVTMAPVIDMLIKIADPEQYAATFGPGGTVGGEDGRQFEGATDLGSTLSIYQLNALLAFMASIPPTDGDMTGVVANLVAHPDLFFSDTSTLNPLMFAISGSPLLGLTAEALAAVGADVFLRPWGFSASTELRTLKYRLEYAANVNMIGATYSTVIGDANVAGEITYRDNTPVMKANVARTPVRAKLINLHVNSLMVFEPKQLEPNMFVSGVMGGLAGAGLAGSQAVDDQQVLVSGLVGGLVGGLIGLMDLEPITLWDFSSMVIEGITWQIPGKKPYSFEDSDNPDRLAVQNTPTGYGVSMFWSLEYQNVFTGWDVMVPIYVNWGIDGSQFNAGYRDGQVTTATGITFKHLSGIEVGAGYSAFWGDEDDVFMMLTQDRDNATVHFKYGF